MRRYFGYRAACVALLGAVIAATLLAPPPKGAGVELFNRDNPTPLEEAA